MATLTDFSNLHHHHHHHHHHNKITKPRGGKMVKPILKKLASSPKNSLDLDRGWEDQTVDLGYGGNSSSYEAGRTSMSRSVRDVSFQFSPWEPGYASGGGGSTNGSGTATPVAGLDASAPGARNMPRGRYQQHARSTSGTSHVSITTNGSSHRLGGSFVHPFQQMPRTNTPPLTYANSFTSFERDNNPAREYSPTIITENDDDDEYDHHPPAAGTTLLLSQSLASPHHNQPHHHHKSLSQPSNSHSTASLRRPSLASQRTSSLSDIKNHSAASAASPSPSAITSPSLRLNTNLATSAPRSVPSAAASRLAHGSLNTSFSNSDLQLNSSPSDSPRPSLHLASPGTSTVPMSPLRNSLEGAFRLRSRSEVDMGARREDVREARRKFEENERIKQEKYESEQRRKQERKQREAARKMTGGSDGRPSFSRKRTPPLGRSSAGSITAARRVRSAESGTAVVNEKVQGGPGSPGLLSSNYETTEGGAAPNFGQNVNDVRFETPQRSNTTKRKTQGYWTSFMLWLRTRLLKLGRR